MADPLLTPETGIVGGTSAILGAIIVQLIGLLKEKLAKPSPAPAEPAPIQREVEIRLSMLEKKVESLDAKLDDIGINVAKASAEIGTLLTRANNGRR